ncbi:MAG: radical SAM protein [Candidatus Lokiarchaeota archaeon]|nr:radical SAM protein [Candidatus Lokiarchaeota archaeon]
MLLVEIMVVLSRNIYQAPFLKQILQTLGRNYSKYCHKCKSTRYDVAISYLIEEKKNKGEICLKCRLKAGILSIIIKMFFFVYGFELNKISQFYSNTRTRRVIKNFFKGLALFGLRKPFTMGAPLSVVWNVTSNCNLKCSHCFADANFNQHSESDLSTKEAKKVIRMLAANDIITLNFCGGEPLMRNDLFELISYARDFGISPSISTNATLLNKEVCEELYNSGVRSITISLDGLSAKSHDHLRNVKGAYDMTINGIKVAAEFGKFDELIIATTLTDYNHSEVPLLYDYVKELGATRYYLGRLLPVGRGKSYIKHDPSPEVKRNVLKLLAQKLIKSVRDKDEIMVITRGMPYFSRICYELSSGSIYPLCELITGYETKLTDAFENKIANFIQRISSVFSGCAAGLFYIGLDSQGNVLPCATSSHIKLGNILNQGLHDIWLNNSTLNLIRERRKKKGKCARCFGKEFCGGCRLTAYNMTGDWLESDFSCPY